MPERRAGALTRPRLLGVLLLLVAVLLVVIAVRQNRAGTAPAADPSPAGRSSSTAPTSRGAEEPPRSATPQAAQRVALEESFDGDRLDRDTWNTCHWWDDDGCTIASNDELEWYRPEQVTVADGTLRLTAEPDPYTTADGTRFDFRSGMVTTGPTPDDGPAKVAITYGTVDVRFKAPAGRGLWPAIWLLPADRESRPEIDLLEMVGQDPGELIMHLHPADREADSPSHRHRLSGPDLAGGWHTIGLSWTPGKLVYLLDGKPVWTVKGDQVPSEPMYLVMNLAVGGAYPGPPDDRTPFPATFEIDHVRMTTGV